MDKIKTDRERTEVEILALELNAVSDALLVLAGEAEVQHATEIHKWANDALEMVMVFEDETAKRLEEYEER